ncbi:MAG: dynamin family protein [Anaerolineales bacterium]|nr:dynamin family protein [Anaerolineales bacterium]
MSSSLSDLLNHTKELGERFDQQWHLVRKLIVNQIETDFKSHRDDPAVTQYISKICNEAREMQDVLAKSLHRLLDEVLRPELIIATTGTTSSGKSALVNLLCGAEIIPVAVQEMSAGVVTICHGPAAVLTVRPTEGAVWETGTWTDLDDYAINERLYAVMEAYRKVRDREINEKKPSQAVVAPPQIELEYPTYVGKNPSLLGLPTGFRFRLLDLPGMKFIGDESNLNVIREHCREALCLVTYNSEETDPIKQDELLDQVVEQVKYLGGSPSRMLFILNRIDAFRKNPHWEKDERDFVDRITNQIKTRLLESLPEYKLEISNISPLTLSPLPALYAHQLLTLDSEYLPALARKLRNHFGFLIPDSVQDDLPTNPNKWQSHQFQQVAEITWSAARADRFFTTLADHIRRYLPDLLVPRIIHRFNKTCGKPLADWAMGTASAHLNAHKENYEAEIKRINQAKANLDRMFRQKEQHLLEHFQNIIALFEKYKDPRDLFDQISHILHDFVKQPPYNSLPEGALEPLTHWQEALKRDCNKALRAIAQMPAGLSYPDVLNSLPTSIQIPLILAARRLQDLGYRPGEDHTFEAWTSARKEELERHIESIRTALHDFSRAAAKCLQEIVKQQAAHQQGRISDAICKLISIYWNDVTTHASHILRSCGLTMPPHMPFDMSLLHLYGDKSTNELNLAYAFSTDVDLDIEKPWWLLWWFWLDRYKYTITWPDTKTLLEDWEKETRRQDPVLMQHLAKWIIDTLGHAATAVRRQVEKALAQYSHKLEEAHSLAEKKMAETHAVWQPILHEAQQLSCTLENLSQLCNVSR